MNHLFVRNEKGHLRKLVMKGITTVSACSMLIAAGMNGNVMNAAAASKESTVGQNKVMVSLTDGRDTGKTTAKIRVISGPPIAVHAEARIYYCFGFNAYYTTSGEKITDMQVSVTAKKQLAGAEVDQCRGYYKAISGDDHTWTPILTIGKLSRDIKEYKKL